MHVIDTLYNNKLLRTWRSEDYRQAGALSPREQIRRRAQHACNELNGVAAKVPKGSHTCPFCGGAKSYYAARCMPCRTQDDQHGTLSTYNNRGCRCAACRNANAAYHREYKARL